MTKEEITLLVLMGWKQIPFPMKEDDTCKKCLKAGYRWVTPAGTGLCARDTIQAALKAAKKIDI